MTSLQPYRSRRPWIQAVEPDQEMSYGEPYQPHRTWPDVIEPEYVEEYVDPPRYFAPMRQPAPARYGAPVQYTPAPSYAPVPQYPPELDSISFREFLNHRGCPPDALLNPVIRQTMVAAYEDWILAGGRRLGSYERGMCEISKAFGWSWLRWVWFTGEERTALKAEGR